MTAGVVEAAATVLASALAAGTVAGHYVGRHQDRARKVDRMYDALFGHDGDSSTGLVHQVATMRRAS